MPSTGFPDTTLLEILVKCRLKMRVWIQLRKENSALINGTNADKNFLAIPENTREAYTKRTYLFRGFPAQKRPFTRNIPVMNPGERVACVQRGVHCRGHEPASLAADEVINNVYIVFWHCYNAVHLYMFRGS